jgi:hypothetical protein
MLESLRRLGRIAILHREMIAPRCASRQWTKLTAPSGLGNMSVPRDGELDLVGLIKHRFGCLAGEGNG